jgi:hypothetical protein
VLAAAWTTGTGSSSGSRIAVVLANPTAIVQNVTVSAIEACGATFNAMVGAFAVAVIDC